MEDQGSTEEERERGLKSRKAPGPHAPASNRHTFLSCHLSHLFICILNKLLLCCIVSRFHFLAEVRAKNVYQSMTGKGFSGKENIQTASYAVIGAAFTIFRLCLVQVKYGKQWERNVCRCQTAAWGQGALRDFERRGCEGE